MIITDDSILNGMSDSANIGMKGQFIESIGIDPDMPIADDAPINDFLGITKKPSGAIRPVNFDTQYISGLDNEAALWMVTNPKNAILYIATRGGEICELESDLSSSSAIITSSGGRGYGLEYYNNNLLIAEAYKVSRYSYLDEATANRRYDQTFWATELGFDPMEYTLYPELHGLPMPCHAIHRHVPTNAAYVCDSQDGAGCLHKIRLKEGVDSFDTATHEGAVDDDSEFQVLDFGKGMYPTCIESMGSYLIIGLIEMAVDESGDEIWEQKSAKLALWDTTSDSFQDITPDDFSDPLITAIKNVNGTVYVFSGASAGGCRVSRFLGVEKLNQLHYISNAYPPLAGAVDKLMDKVTFGTGLVTGMKNKGVGYSIGSVYPSFRSGLHGTIAPSYTGSRAITALRYYESGQLKNQPLISEMDSLGNNKIAKYADGTVEEIYIRIHIDNATKFEDIDINSSLFYREKTIKVYPDSAKGEINFFIEIAFGNNCLWKSSMKQMGGPFTLESIQLNFANRIDDDFLPVVQLPITYEVSKENV